MCKVLLHRFLVLMVSFVSSYWTTNLYVSFLDRNYKPSIITPEYINGL